MSELARLCDITTEPGSDLENFCFLENELELDSIEYNMGMSRGDITLYSSITTIQLHRDMAQLFRSGSWALLPSLDIIQKVHDLYDYNQKPSTSTASRKLFSETLPQKEYEYEFLPLCTPDKLPLYIGEVRYDYPYPNFPRVKTMIHPCIALRSIFLYTLYNPEPPSILADEKALIPSISILTSLCVNLSWLHGTWDDFPDRKMVSARPDPRPKRRLPLMNDADGDGPAADHLRDATKHTTKQLYLDQHSLRDEEDDEDESSDGYGSDEPRDLDDPRILARREKWWAYMAKHNRRYQEEEAEDEVDGDGSRKRKRSDATSSDSAPLRRSKRLQSGASGVASSSKKRPRSAPTRGKTSKRVACSSPAREESMVSAPTGRRSARTR